MHLKCQWTNETGVKLHFTAFKISFQKREKSESSQTNVVIRHIPTQLLSLFTFPKEHDGKLFE